jgi:hypothetical protein
VSGEPRLDANGYPRNAFAAATNFAGDVVIGGVRPAGAPKIDFLGVELTGVDGPRTFTICETVGCPFVYFDLGFNGNGDTFDREYVFTAGTVTITSIDATRMRGSFQGTAVYIDPTTGEPDATRTITVTNGQFDAPVRNDLLARRVGVPPGI